MLIKHLYNGKVFVQIDSDCDGYTSAAVLLNYLYQWVPSIVKKNFSYGFHLGKQHGINMEIIPEGTTLIIAPDSSSNEYEIHKELVDKGIDVLVIDHHQAEYESQYACVVNNQLCDYSTKSLSGVGMVYKVCQYLDKLNHINQADSLIDLVSLGLIADMMDLRDFETIHYVRKGLENIRNPFLKEMVNENSYSLGEEITPIGIAFYVAPYVNAITRVGQEEEKRTLFEAMLEWKAYESIPSTKRGCKGQFEQRVEQAVRNCTNAKSRQTRMRDQGLDAIENLIKEQNLLKHKILLIKLEKDINKNISGLIANELMSKYKRPTLLLSPRQTEKGFVYEGSARGYEKSKLSDFKSFVKSFPHTYLAEGHPNAFGFGIEAKYCDAFIEWADNVLANIEFTPCYKVDFIYSAQTLKSNDILDIGEMKHLWGQNVDEPLIAVEGIAVTKDNITLMSKDKRPTLKITLPNGVACIKFKSSQEEFKNLFSESGCVIINIVGKCSVNKYYNMITPQILVENYDIVKRQNYYF